MIRHLCTSSELDSKRGAPLELPVPLEQLSVIASDVPPMEGGEYVSSEFLSALWTELVLHIQHAISNFKGSAAEYFHTINPAWNVVGRVCFHLAENKQNVNLPFAFLATYTNRLSTKATPQHLPLGRAIKEFSSAADKIQLLGLLKPVQTASEHSVLLKELFDSGDIFRPLAWSPKDAYNFLRDIPKFEDAGIVVRVPDWWHAKKPPRPEVKVTVGKNNPSGIGLSALLDFQVQISLEGEELTTSEWEAILKHTSGLVSIKGRWVEIDKEKLVQVLDHWRNVQKSVAEDGISFSSAMRLLVGASELGDGLNNDTKSADRANWQNIVAGDWLKKKLDELKDPNGGSQSDPGPALKATLRTYQKSGVDWLWHLYQLRLGACLADDMGLGKTIQVLSLLILLKNQRNQNPYYKENFQKA